MEENAVFPRVSRYYDLPAPANKIIATYIWIDDTGENLRSKDRILDLVPKQVNDLPPWITAEIAKDEPGGYADIFLRPRALYKDPFYRGDNVLVMCDTYTHNMDPTGIYKYIGNVCQQYYNNVKTPLSVIESYDTNNRLKCQEAYDKCKDTEPWFGIEQEYFLFGLNGRPMEWPPGGGPPQPSAYYCGVGTNRVFARPLIQDHLRCCLYAGIPICGTNAEVAPCQWEFQVGPSAGVSAGDDLWVARYILQYLSEEYKCVVSFDPKPIPDLNGSGVHINFSTKKMRAENGIIEIEKAIDKLSRSHMKHIKVYDPREGKDNERRLTGLYQTSTINDFSAGVADRSCSVRIPRVVAEEKRGYLEDRRPASNCDPYAVVDALMRTCILDE